MPWTGLPTLRQELDRLFARFDEDMLKDVQLTGWNPALDVKESNGEYIVKAECPGVDAKDLRVRLENGVLTIEGEKKTEHEEESDRMYRRERSFGAFSREIRFPMPTDGTKVKAHLANGVLTLKVPKSASAPKESNIPIQVG
jgi:HSP20 family protein